MKKAIALILILCLLCAGLAACASTYGENVWYSQEKLEECLVSDLPALHAPHLVQDDWMVFANLTREESDAYAQSVYSYLIARQFPYLGTRGHQRGSLAGAFTSYYFQPTENLEQHLDEGDYRFVYSEDGITFYYLTVNRLDSYPHDYDGKMYNVQIGLRADSEFPLGGKVYYDPEGIDPCFFRHSYGESAAYPLPGTDRLIAVRYCAHCGLEDSGYDGDYGIYDLAVEEGREYLLTLPESHASGELKSHVPGTLVKLYTHKYMDADIVFTANGTVIRSYEAGDYWCFAFVMPDGNVTITLDLSAGFPE